MKITAVEALHLRLPVIEAIADGTQEVLIVRVRTDAGLVGLGEAVSSSYVARAIVEAPRSAPRRHGLAAILDGSDPLDPEARWHDMIEGSSIYGLRGAAVHAISAVDTALWDIRARAEGVSLSRLWGRRRDRVRAYASVLFPDTAAEAEAVARDLIAQGVTAIKFGWGPFGTDRALDLELLDAVTSAAGSGVEILVDAGRSWDVATAADRAPELFERFDIGWLEDPLHDPHPSGYAALTPQVQGRIATGEMEDGYRAYEELIAGGVRVVQPDVGRAGGLTVCRRISELAYREGVWAVPHCFGTGVLLAASLQWVGAAPEAPLTEYPLTRSPLRNELVIGAPEVREGWVAIPDAPGLGVELDEGVVERFRVS
jgi:L-alanine-DL-glutamate epimerase-like enolase superfamily enzyme